MPLLSRPAGLHEQENFLPPRQLVPVIVTLGTVLFVINIDHNGFSTLLPTIADDLDAQKSITWAGSSALIATAVVSVLYGRFSDIFGRKALFVSALTIFSITELACGFARSPSVLYALRALIGLSGGGIGNLATIIATDVVSLRQRGQYMAIISPFMVSGNICGPLVAAGFVRSPFTWRGLFYFLSPLGGLSAAFAVYMLPSTAPIDSFRRNLAKIDWLGSLTSTVAIVAFLIPLLRDDTWDSKPIIISLSVSGASLVAFLLVEWKVASLPILPLTLFRTPDVSALLIQTFTLGWINHTNVYYFPFYAQNLRKWSPIVSGAMLLPMIAVQLLVSMLAGRWMSKSGRYGGTIQLGVLLLLLGSLVETQFDRHLHPVGVLLTMLTLGVGVGAANQPMVVAMQAHTKKSERAVVTSTRNFFRFLGSACGVAVSAAVLQSTLRASLPAEYKHLANSAYGWDGLDQAAREAIIPSYETAIRYVFITSAGASVVCALGLLVWRDHGYDSRPAEDGEYGPVGEPDQQDEERPLLQDNQGSLPFGANGAVVSGRSSMY